MATNENLNNQSDPKRTGQVRPNPSRNNKNTKGQSNEKSFDANNDSDRDLEIDTAGLDRDEINLDRSGVSRTQNSKDDELAADDTGTQERDPGLQAGSGADYGSGAVHGEDRQSKRDVSGQRSNQLNQNQEDSKRQ